MSVMVCLLPFLRKTSLDQIPEEADKRSEFVSSACKLRFPDEQQTASFCYNKITS